MWRRKSFKNFSPTLVAFSWKENVARWTRDLSAITDEALDRKAEIPQGCANAKEGGVMRYF
ncbi:MAG: hypothetical protein AAFP28_13775, partial [Pseudomonadota bacterium]